MNIVDLLAVAAAFAITGWFIWMVLRKDRDKERFEEDDARAFFDEHGHWPDETPEEVEARRRRADAAELRARAEDREF